MIRDASVISVRIVAKRRIFQRSRGGPGEVARARMVHRVIADLVTGSGRAAPVVGMWADVAGGEKERHLRIRFREDRQTLREL